MKWIKRTTAKNCLTNWEDEHIVKSDLKTEIEIYSMEAVPPEEDIFSYWASREKTYPRLSSLARKILPIPSSSSTSEVMFSNVGRTLEVRRIKLLGENLNAILFLHSLN